MIRTYSLFFASVFMFVFSPCRIGHAGDNGWVILFGSRNCDECQTVKKQWQRDFQPAADPVLVFLEVENNANYQLLCKIENILEVTEQASSFPIFLVGNRLLPDVDSFYDLDDEIRTLAAKPLDLPEFAGLNEAARMADVAVISWDAPSAGTAQMSAAFSPAISFSRYLLYFMQQNCAKCSRQQKELDLLKEQLPDLHLTNWDIATMAGQVMLSRARRHLQIAEDLQNPVPMVCWAEGYVNERLVRAEELKKILKPMKTEPFWLVPITEEEFKAEEQHQGQNLQTFSGVMIMLAGLGDGFNPCAFATSIFLIGYLLYLKRRPREIALVGAGFCVGVFFTYFLFGLGISFLLDFFNHLLWFKVAIYAVFGVAGLLLCIGHLRDAFRYRKTGKASTMSLGLSSGTHQRIHEKIRALAEKRSWLMLPAALLLG
ncbi:MAG: hypothetical protein WCT05_10125, partial [Lentisphaeria bacterium]